MTRLPIIEERALHIRHMAATRLLKTDPSFTGIDALAMVVSPPPDLLEASLTKARLELGQEACRRCGNYTLDDEGYCSMCGSVTPAAATPDSAATMVAA